MRTCSFNLIVTGALRATGDAIYPVVASVGSFALVLGVGSYFLGMRSVCVRDLHRLCRRRVGARLAGVRPTAGAGIGWFRMRAMRSGGGAGDYALVLIACGR